MQRVSREVEEEGQPDFASYGVQLRAASWFPSGFANLVAVYILHSIGFVNCVVLCLFFAAFSEYFTYGL